MKTSIVNIGPSSPVFGGIQVNSDEFKTGLLQSNMIYEVPNPSELMKPLHDLIYPVVEPNGSKKDTGILPPGVLALTGNFVVFERPPEFKNVFIIPSVVSEMSGSSYKDSNIYTYRIPLPWQLYIVHFNINKGEDGEDIFYTTDVRMHFMSSHLDSFDQEVYLTPIPNFYSNGNLCRPMFSSMEETERYPKNIAGVIQSAHDWIWNNGTNLDLTESIVQYFIQAAVAQIDIKKTVFGKNFEYMPISMNHGAYYTNMSTIDMFLTEWENYSLEEVLELYWPQNSKFGSHNQDFRYFIVHYLPQFLREVMGQEPSYNLHSYEDDEDEESYPDGRQCEIEDHPDNFCDCMYPENYYDQSAFRKWIYENKSIPKVTAESSIMNFFKEFGHGGSSINNYRSDMIYNSMLTKIRYSA